MATTINLDGIITSVDVETGISSKGKEYQYLSIKFDTLPEVRLFPPDRSLLTVLRQEVELTELRKK